MKDTEDELGVVGKEHPRLGEARVPVLCFPFSRGTGGLCLHPAGWPCRPLTPAELKP